MRPPRAASPAVTLAGRPPPVPAGNRAPALSIWTPHCAARQAGTAVLAVTRGSRGRSVAEQSVVCHCVPQSGRIIFSERNDAKGGVRVAKFFLSKQ